MTIERAQIRDRRVRELADKIFKSQGPRARRDEALFPVLERNPQPANAPDLLAYRQRDARAPK